jgi:hypothetical protein
MEIIILCRRAMGLNGAGNSAVRVGKVVASASRLSRPTTTTITNNDHDALKRHGRYWLRVHKLPPGWGPTAPRCRRGRAAASGHASQLLTSAESEADVKSLPAPVLLPLRQPPQPKLKQQQKRLTRKDGRSRVTSTRAVRTLQSPSLAVLAEGCACASRYLPRHLLTRGGRRQQRF